jgi:hypothetical protein
VEFIMTACRTCGARTCANRSFCRACRNADRRTARQAYREIDRPTPEVVIEAIMFAVRERGLAALKEPATAERLKRCDATARIEINQRIEKLGLEP